MNLPTRGELTPGTLVYIVKKEHQPTGQLTRGRMLKCLTKSSSHPHGIKVMLEDGQIGRVKAIANEQDEA